MRLFSTDAFGCLTILIRADGGIDGLLTDITVGRKEERRHGESFNTLSIAMARSHKLIQGL
jgi:hypothetical protein